jgi:hypothetical protein
MQWNLPDESGGRFLRICCWTRIAFYCRHTSERNYSFWSPDFGMDQRLNPAAGCCRGTDSTADLPPMRGHSDSGAGFRRQGTTRVPLRELRRRRPAQIRQGFGMGQKRRVAAAEVIMPRKARLRRRPTTPKPLSADLFIFEQPIPPRPVNLTHRKRSERIEDRT